jgi:hypothetical protein
VIAWDASLIRRMPIAGCTAQVSVCVLRQEDGEPSFEVTWSPRRPERLTHEDITLFDRFKAQAIAELRAELLAPSKPRKADSPSAKRTGWSSTYPSNRTDSTFLSTTGALQ